MSWVLYEVQDERCARCRHQLRAFFHHSLAHFQQLYRMYANCSLLETHYFTVFQFIYFYKLGGGDFYLHLTRPDKYGRLFLIPCDLTKGTILASTAKVILYMVPETHGHV